MANQVLIRAVRSDGQQFIIGSGAWRILSDGLKGIDFPSFDIFTDKNAVGDGAIISGKRISDRDIQIEARSVDPTQNRTIREATISFFNPKHSFKLYITYQGVTKWIGCELEGFSCPSENIHRPMQLTVKFYAADPMLRSVDDYGQDIASITPGFGFPYMEATSPLIPVYASTFNFRQQTVIDNDGDVTSFPRIEITFTGNVTNPKIYKDADHYVRVIDTFENGDNLVIDCEACTIKKNGVNCIQNIDRASTFTEMGLEVGTNLIGFAADTGDTYMAVVLYYNKLYLGL